MKVEFWAHEATQSHMRTKAESSLLNAVVEHLPASQVFLIRELFNTDDYVAPKDIKFKKETGRDQDPDDPAATPRQVVLSLRDSLAKFAITSEGKSFPIRFEVDTLRGRGYRLRSVFTRTPLQQFWWPYLSQANKQVLIVYPEPRFFRLNSRLYVRHQDVQGDDPAELRAKVDWLQGDPVALQPYVGAGDADAALVLTRYFERVGVRTDHMIAHRFNGEIAGQNVILIGNARNFKWAADKLRDQGSDFQLEAQQVVNHNPLESDHIEARHPEPDDSTSLFQKGVVSRYHSKNRSSCVTVFLSNHSRFCEAAVRELTNEDTAEAAVSRVIDPDILEVPGRFELIGKAKITDDDQTVRDYEFKWLASRPSRGAEASPS